MDVPHIADEPVLILVESDQVPGSVVSIMWAGWGLLVLLSLFLVIAWLCGVRIDVYPDSWISKRCPRLLDFFEKVSGHKIKNETFRKAVGEMACFLLNSIILNAEEQENSEKRVQSRFERIEKLINACEESPDLEEAIRSILGIFNHYINEQMQR